MSEMLPGAPVPTKPIKVPPRDTNTNLTVEELEGQRRFLAHPETFPDAFKSWLIDFIAVNGSLIPPSQILGGGLLKGAYTAEVTTSEATSSASYADLATAGPSLTGLSNGTYMLLFGSQIGSTSNSFTGYMSLSLNGATASDDDSIRVNWTVTEGAATESLTVPGARAMLQTLDSGDNNTVTAKYKTSGVSVAYGNRWIVAIKVGN